MRTLSCLIALSTLAIAAGCARTVPEVAAPSVPVAHSQVATPQPAAPAAAAPEEYVASESAAFTQKPGDYVVYRFSGGFTKAPLLFTQRVVEASDLLLVVDIVLDDGRHKTSARARYTHAPGALHELLSASRIDANGTERPMPLTEFDALMARTGLAADENQGAIGTEAAKVSAGGHDISCTQTRYRVVVGKRLATMRTLSSESFPWGDLGGDIVADDGRVLYRAEVVDLGGPSPIVAASR